MDNESVSSPGHLYLFTGYPQCGKPSSRGLFYELVIVVLFDFARDFRHLVIERPALFHKLTDFFVRIHHGGVVAIAKKLPNFRQRQACHFAAEVHRNLARQGGALRSRGPVEVFNP